MHSIISSSVAVAAALLCTEVAAWDSGYESPAYAAPAYTTPTYEGQSYSTPSYEAPAYSSSPYQAPAAYSSPAYEASSGYGWSSTSYESPAYTSTTYEAPAYTSPTYGSPAYSSPPPSCSAPPPSSGETSMVTVVEVGADGQLAFNPPNVNVPVGSMVQFQFHPENHSVVQASFDSPCVPINNVDSSIKGFFSGFMPAALETQGLLTFTIEVTSTDPVWFYCSQSTHCQGGMVGSINAPTTGNTLEKFKEAASKAPNNVSPGGYSPPAAYSSGYGYASGTGYYSAPKWTTSSYATSSYNVPPPAGTGSYTPPPPPPPPAPPAGTTPSPPAVRPSPVVPSGAAVRMVGVDAGMGMGFMAAAAWFVL